MKPKQWQHSKGRPARHDCRSQSASHCTRASNEIGRVHEMKPGDFKPLRSSVLQIKLMEVNMAKTAVGLFENPSSVDAVVRDLKASGFPQKDVRSEERRVGKEGRTPW